MKLPPLAASLLLASTWLVSGGTAAATVVSGQVTTAAGQGIADVDLDFIDANTGVSVPLTNDRTDVLGFYAVSVPAGTYTVRFKPPLGTRFVGVELRGVSVQGGSMTLDQVLQSGWMITGRVVDDLEIPVTSVDLDAIDATTGDPVFTSHDTSDASGNFNIVVPAGTYRVEFEPPAGSNLVPVRRDGLVVASDVPLGTVALRRGVHLSGDVQDDGAGAVSNVLVRSLEPATGVEVFTTSNRTDAAGHFDVLLVPGAYDLRFEPPRGSPMLPRSLYGVSLPADRLLPPVALDRGVTASGRVRDGSGRDADGVDLDFVNPFSGVKQLTPHDNTNVDGEYAVTVRRGTYDITFDPPAGSGLAPLRLSGVFMGSDLSLPEVNLPPGFIVSGSVHDASLNPAGGVDLDFTDLSTSVPVYTPRDDTDASGGFAVVVPAGTYEIRFSPPDGSGSGMAIMSTVTVRSSLSVGTVTLPPSFPAQPEATSPASGSAAGGTLVTVTGSGFAPGARVKVGGVTVSGMVRLDDTTLQGLTRAHPPGRVDVEVINPGAPTAVLISAFTYLPPDSDPSLTLSSGGPVGTDLTLEWTSTGQPRYTVYRSSVPGRFTELERVDVVEGTTFRDEGAMIRPDNHFYVVQ